MFVDVLEVYTDDRYSLKFSTDTRVSFHSLGGLGEPFAHSQSFVIAGDNVLMLRFPWLRPCLYIAGKNSIVVAKRRWGQIRLIAPRAPQVAIERASAQYILGGNGNGKKAPLYLGGELVPYSIRELTKRQQVKDPLPGAKRWEAHYRFELNTSLDSADSFAPSNAQIVQLLTFCTMYSPLLRESPWSPVEAPIVEDLP